MWLSFGIAVHDTRLARRWSVRELARRADVSAGMVYRIESGAPASTDTAQRIAAALGRRAELTLVDPRRRDDPRPSLSADPVHSAMGELEAGHLRAMGYRVGIDEPYQHFQFAGRADVVAWHLERRAILHIENRTRFPDVQQMAGAYNAKRAYLAASLAERLGVRHWSSQTHVLVVLWSAEALHAIRLRTDTFRSLCPDEPAAWRAWWDGQPPSAGHSSTLVVLDPLAAPRQRLFVGLEEVPTVRPRHRGYAQAAERLASRARVTSAA